MCPTRTGVADTAGDGNGQVTISWCCSSQTFGQPQDTSGNPLTSPIPADTPVVDSASVTPGESYTGTATPSGTVSFYVCRPARLRQRLHLDRRPGWERRDAQR